MLRPCSSPGALETGDTGGSDPFATSAGGADEDDL